MANNFDDCNGLAVRLDGTVSILNLDKDGKVIDETLVDNELATRIFANAVEDALRLALDANEEKEEDKAEETG